jgi:hypothetical protein
MIPAVTAERPVAASLDELLAGATRLGAFTTAETRSDAPFEAVELDGERCVVKFVHPDFDFTMRVSDDRGCRALQVWQHGLMDLAPERIDHATLGVARWGRDDLGCAVLMRDVSASLVPPGDDPIPEADHHAFLDDLAAWSIAAWGFEDRYGLLEHHKRWAFFSAGAVESERALGFPEAVPRIAAEGWARFAERAPRDVFAVIDELWHDPRPLSDAVRTTPQTLTHGDWKLSNLGRGADGRTILLDWMYPGQGPVCHELLWYTALNRARLPVGHTKESTIADFRAALVRQGLEVDSWWDRQLGLCLVGTLVQFGWEKALGDDSELTWWVDAARDGARFL